MTIERFGPWQSITAYQRDARYVHITYDDGRVTHAYLFDAPILRHEFERVPGDYAPLWIYDGGEIRVAGFRLPEYVTREAILNAEFRQ